jgi:hypothetical protein
MRTALPTLLAVLLLGTACTNHIPRSPIVEREGAALLGAGQPAAQFRPDRAEQSDLAEVLGILMWKGDLVLSRGVSEGVVEILLEGEAEGEAELVLRAGTEGRGGPGRVPILIAWRPMEDGRAEIRLRVADSTASRALTLHFANVRSSFAEIAVEGGERRYQLAEATVAEGQPETPASKARVILVVRGVDQVPEEDQPQRSDETE